MYRVLCADAPWPFNDALPGDTRGAVKNYATMSVKDIENFIFKERIASQLHDDCTLFLWRVASMQQEALNVVNAWGFTVKTEIVWLKKTINGQRWFGMGRTVRAEHEICLVATRGRPETIDKSVRSTFVTDMDFEGLSALNTKHSAKPEEFYQIVEALRAGPYMELFARRHRPGWTCLGLEANSKQHALNCPAYSNYQPPYESCTCGVEE